MNFKLLFAALGLMLGLMTLAAVAEDETVGEPSHFLRGAYQYGWVLGTNDFVSGNNAKGEPIKNYYTVRLDFGWQTDGSQDWHHLFNFPSYGVGTDYGVYSDKEEMGSPISVYGFFTWPVKRWGRNSLNVNMGFGMSGNWTEFDEVQNPYNLAIGADRTLFIEIGATYEMSLSRRWALLAGFTSTHYSNGGAPQPNWGINQIGPLVYAKYNFQEKRLPKVRRHLAPYVPRWFLTTTLSAGARSLKKDLRSDPDYESYLTKNYLAADLNLTANRQFSRVFRYGFGLDVEYDDSVTDLALIEATEDGTEVDSINFFDKLSLGVVGGVVAVANRGELVVQLGYTVLRKDVEGRVPLFYQRVGLRIRAYRELYAGVNVRFHDFTWADNLELGLGYRWGI